jgi:trans-2-enoyl-CoA reductase
LKDSLACPDLARRLLVYKKDSDKVVKDIGGEKLVSLLCEELYTGKKKVFDEVQKMVDECEIMNATQKIKFMAEVSSLYENISKTADGKEQDNARFKSRLVKLLCNLADSSKKKDIIGKNEYESDSEESFIDPTGYQHSDMEENSRVCGFV